MEKESGEMSCNQDITKNQCEKITDNEKGSRINYCVNDSSELLFCKQSTSGRTNQSTFITPSLLQIYSLMDKNHVPSYRKLARALGMNVFHQPYISSTSFSENTLMMLNNIRGHICTSSSIEDDQRNFFIFLISTIEMEYITRFSLFAFLFMMALNLPHVCHTLFSIMCCAFVLLFAIFIYLIFKKLLILNRVLATKKYLDRNVLNWKNTPYYSEYHRGINFKYTLLLSLFSWVLPSFENETDEEGYPSIFEKMKGYSLTNCEEIHLDDAGERCCNCYEMRGKSETSESHYRMNLMKNRENDTKEKESASVAKEERLLLLCEPNALANEAANSQEENAKCQRGPNQNSKIHGEIIDEIDGDKDITCNIITSDTKKIPDAVPASGVSNKVTMECLTSAEEAGLQIEHKYAEGCINAENSEKTPDDETKPSKIAGKNNSSLMTEEEEEGEKELSERSSKDRKESENCSSECQNLTNSGRSESVERHNEDISQERRSCDASTERAQSSKKLKHHPHSKHQPSSSHRHRSLQRKGSRFHKKNDRAADSDSASSFVASSKNSAHERNDREDFSVDSLEVSEASEMTASVDRSVYSRSSRSLSHSSVSPASVSASQSRSPSRSPSSSFTEHERFNSEDERFDECNERKRRSGVKRQQSGYSKGENKDNYLSSTRHSRPRYGDRTKRESVRGEKQGRKNGERRYSSCDSDSESRTRSRRSDDEYRSSRKEFDRDEMSDESIVSQSPEEQSICERRRKSRK